MRTFPIPKVTIRLEDCSPRERAWLRQKIGTLTSLSCVAYLIEGSRLHKEFLALSQSAGAQAETDNTPPAETGSVEHESAPLKT